jgi:hypothetical protein
MPFYSLYNGGDTDTAVAINQNNVNLGDHATQHNSATALAGSSHYGSGGLVNIGDVDTAVAINAGNVNLGDHATQDNSATAVAGSTHFH